MTTFWQSGKTVVTRLRVRCSGIDPISAQLRVTSLFNAAHVHPVGLPPSAIICIRKLLDPQPGTLRLAQGSVRPPLAWEQAVAASLNQLVRRAVRPALGAVPTDAEAVIFLDRSELLACLASDWCDGSAVAHWWWQSLFKGVGSARAVLDTWLDMPAYIPAALQHMAERGQAIPFVRMLSINHARALLQSMTRSFALHDLQSVLKAVLDESGRGMHSEVKTLKFEEAARQLGPPPSAFNTPQNAPWQSWVPASESDGLGLEHQCLLGIALMLQRAPMVVRTQSFTRAVLQWRQAIEQSGLSGTFKAATGLVTANESRQLPTFSKAIVDENNTFTPMAKPPTAERVVSLEPLPVEQGLGAAHMLLSAPATPMVRMTHAVLAPEPPDSGILPMSELNQMRLTLHEPGMVSTRPSPSLNQVPDAITLPEAHITTALGGVFYLINLGLFLGIYGDFTTPAHPGIPLPVWDFVALLGQQLIGDTIYADPVWPLLAHLAGRTVQEAPGKNFDPPDVWRVPEAWLEPFPKQVSGIVTPRADACGYSILSNF